MKSLVIALAVSMGVAAGQATSGSNTLPTSPEQIKIPKLRAFTPPQPKRIELPNGAVVFLIEDHEIPLITFTAEFRGGSRDEPAAKVGLTDIFGEVWRTGGTTAKTGDQVDDLLERKAAKLETGAELESTTIGGDCLKEDFDTLFGLFLEFVNTPEFREDKIELAKQQADTGISRRNDDAGAIASREMVKIAYGKDNPYARTAEYSTIAAITRDDLLAWKKKYVVAGNMIFGIAGDFDPAQMEQKLRTALMKVPTGPKYQPVKVNFTDPRPGVYYAEKDDVNQSQVQMVALGTERNNPDYFAISVMNEAWGSGGFSSRLMNRLRSAQGLTYGVSGAYGAGWDHPGLFRIALSTKSGTTAKAIESLYTEVDNATKEPFTQDEVKHAVDSLLNQFVFRYDSPEKALRERMTLEFYGYPADFYKRYYDAVSKMGPEDVNRVARKYINRQKLATVVVGNQKDFDTAWKTLGQVTPIDITIPEAAQSAAGAGGSDGAAAPAASAKAMASTAEGKALAQKALDFAGGVSALTAVKSVAYKQNIKLVEPAIELTAQSAAILPDQIHQTMTTPQGEMTTIIGPKGAAMKMGEMVRPIPASQSKVWLEGLVRTPFNVARHLNDYVFTTGGTRQIGGKGAQVLNISGGGQDFAWFVDGGTGQILGSEYKGQGQAGPVTRTESVESVQTVGGVKVPQQVSIMENGKPSAQVSIEEYKVNPQFDPAFFTPPAAPAGQGSPQ